MMIRSGMRDTVEKRGVRPIVLAFLAVAATACKGPAQYVNPNIDVSEMKTVAVLPFVNVSNDRMASEKVQRIFVTELLATGAFDVLEPGAVARALLNEKLDPTQITVEDFVRLGKQLKVEGLFVGTIVDYEEGRSSGTSGGRVLIQLRLVDAASGKTYWSTSRAAGGDTVTARLFGMGAKTGVSLAEEVMRDELREIVR